MENVKLSIIIPVYNVEKYLSKCLDSVLVGNAFYGQVICVNDGSTDNSLAILEQYAKKYPNVEIITQTNAGLSAARNAGIEAAKGDYICFLDSDDYLQQNVLGALIEQMEDQQLDVLRFNYQNVREKREVFVPFKTGKPYFDYSSEVVDGETFLNDRLGFACYAVMFIVRRELLDGCIFTPGIYFEDTDWTPRMLLKAKRVASTEMIVYNYLWREGSITLPTSPEKKQKILDDRMKLLYGFQEQKKLVKDDRWFKWHIAATTIAILNTISAYPKYKREQYLQELISLDIFPLSTYRAVGNNKFKIRLANISPSIYCKLMHVMHR